MTLCHFSYREVCTMSRESSAAYLFPKDGYDLTVDTYGMTAADNAGWIYGHCFS